MPNANQIAKIAAAIAAAVAVAAPIAQRFEGYSGKAYLDPARILTQCYGETQDVDPSRIYSKDACAAKLRKRLAADYAPPIIACVPSFADHPAAFGAALDAAYNAGPTAVCHSPMARAFNRGDYKAGCLAFLHWYDSTTYSGKPLTAARMRASGWRLVRGRWVKQLPGLVNRRKREAGVCAAIAP